MYLVYYNYSNAGPECQANAAVFDTDKTSWLEARRGQHHQFQIVCRLQVLIDLYSVYVNEQEVFCIE